MIEILEYWISEKDKNSNIYSCDMLRVVFEMRSDCVNDIGRHFANPLRSDIREYPINLTEFKYRNLFVVDYGQSTMTVGIGFNGTNKQESLKGFFEVNPNKCMGSMKIHSDLSYLLCRCVDYSVVRWDLAIDIPHDREHVHMRKDRRKYELSQTSYANRTEYLGQRNAPGRVKVYNKTLESELDYSLTRVEVTMGKLSDYVGQFGKYMPEVWIDNPQLELVEYKGLSVNQRVLCEAVKDSPDPEYYLRQLDYRMRKKIEPYIIGSGVRLNVNVKYVTSIVTQLTDYLKGLVSHPVLESSQMLSSGVECEYNPFLDEG